VGCSATPGATGCGSAKVVQTIASVEVQGRPSPWMWSMFLSIDLDAASRYGSQTDESEMSKVDRLAAVEVIWSKGSPSIPRENANFSRT
jgi:hypothetical protein